MSRLSSVIGIILMSLVTLVYAENNTPEFLYQKALHLETATADYVGAIKIYEKIINEHKENTEFVAKALHRMGICYEKLGNKDKAEYCSQELNIRKVINKYLDLATTPPQATKEAAFKVIRDLASLFDFANIESNTPAMEELISKYNQILSVEGEAPPEAQVKYEKARQAIRDIFFSNYMKSFQEARLYRAGGLKREDFSIEKIVLSKNLKEATVRIKDKLGVATLKLHKKDNTWLIYCVENPR